MSGSAQLPLPERASPKECRGDCRALMTFSALTAEYLILASRAYANATASRILFRAMRIVSLDT